MYGSPLLELEAIGRSGLCLSGEVEVDSLDDARV